MRKSFVLLLFVVLGVAGSWWALWRQPDLAVPHDTGPSAGDAAGGGTGPAVAEPHRSDGAQTDLGRHDGGAGHGEGDRVALPVEKPVDWEAEAWALIRRSGVSGDVGVSAIVTGLRNSLEGTDPLSHGDPFAVRMPTATDYERNREINVLGRKLSAEDRAQLDEVLREHAQRMRAHNRARHIALQVSLAEALLSRDYVEKPNGSDPDGIFQRVVEASQADFSDPRDQNASEMPGFDFSHNRVVVLRPARYPRYFKTLYAQRVAEAEFSVSLRAWFLPAGGGGGR